MDHFVWRAIDRLSEVIAFVLGKACTCAVLAVAVPLCCIAGLIAALALRAQ
jgi:hypothetical protein